MKIIKGIALATLGFMVGDLLINRDKSFAAKAVKKVISEKEMSEISEKLEDIKTSIKDMWENMQKSGSSEAEIDIVNHPDEASEDWLKLSSAFEEFKRVHMILHPDEELTDDDVRLLVFSE